MATFLDIGVLGYFGVVFAFLLIFVLVYGLLSIIKPFGEGKMGIHAILAVAFAVLSIVNKSVLFLVSFMTPWFFVVIFVGFFIIFILMMFGLKSEQLTAGASPYFRAWPIIVALLILIFGLGGAFGQKTLDEGTGNKFNDSEVGWNSGTGGTGTGGTGEYVDPVTSGGIGNNNVPGTPDKTSTGDFRSNVLNTFVNPQILGMILVIMVGAFAMFFLTKEALD